MNNPSSFVAPLNDLAVIEVSGADAASFLHSQLTHDISGLSPDHARLAGYCTAKGRLLASMVLWRGHEGDIPSFYAIVKADLALALIKRLSMFVLRAKAKLQLTDWKVSGVAVNNFTLDAHTADPNPLQDSTLIKEAQILSGEPQVWDVARTSSGSWICAPSTDPAIVRWWFIAKQPHGAASTLSVDTSVASSKAERWQAADIAAGLPWVVAATQDVFIPQTLNLDLIDGVSFTKGCYPGQEVVARSHYRGTVKRRMAYGIAETGSDVHTESLTGSDIYNTHNPATPCGRIINAARSGGLHVLMEVQLSDLDTAEFRLGQPDGPIINLAPMPYKIRAED
ncbi:folate-binding protein [Candidimonas sp. SYP-B2681]|uniref:CAF17-like 4Fe-4S cluster assembly/insertion protein YgfZ n=1 Tax=Candidimonas sp. SYP-B2681 TaxID=2497686 RepID=UPI000F863DC7|nr:folate-binding protein YgfZ [Candidimonas sp. SYP-B2681]RTZ47967.1 folate-binding protein [Candidimonas sp. SYP-B2681]